MPDPVSIKIAFTPDSLEALKKIAKFPSEWPQAIRRGLDTGLQLVRGKIQENRLSGTGPYPVDEHRLGERKGLLRQSARAEPSVITGNKVVGSVGSNVFYAKVHEYGKTITPVNAPFLVFKIGDKTIFTRKSVIPARAPFTTEVASPQSAAVISKSVINEIKSTAKNL